jgi:hypothetical protein
MGMKDIYKCYGKILVLRCDWKHLYKIISIILNSTFAGKEPVILKYKIMYETTFWDI